MHSSGGCDRNTLIKSAWEGSYASNNSLNVLIASLKKKLSISIGVNDLIIPIRGFGYSLSQHYTIIHNHSLVPDEHEKKPTPFKSQRGSDIDTDIAHATDTALGVSALCLGFSLILLLLIETQL